MAFRSQGNRGPSLSTLNKTLGRFEGCQFMVYGELRHRETDLRARLLHLE
jgi:hypothetical protein